MNKVMHEGLLFFYLFIAALNKKIKTRLKLRFFPIVPSSNHLITGLFRKAIDEISH